MSQPVTVEDLQELGFEETAPNEYGFYIEETEISILWVNGAFTLQSHLCDVDFTLTIENVSDLETLIKVLGGGTSDEQ